MTQKQILDTLDNYLAKNEYSSAKNHLLSCLSQAKDENKDDIILLLNNELMGLCRKIGECEQAITFAQAALEQVIKMKIQNNVGAATTYLNCATVYKAFGMSQDSIVLFETAKNIYEQQLTSNDARLAGLYNNMGLTLVDLGRFDEADNLYAKAISVLQKNYGKQPEQAITYLNMASAAEARYGLEDGEKTISACIQKAMQLLDEGQNMADGNYAFVCEKCASVFGYYGYFDYENQLNQRVRKIYEGT